MDVSIIIVNYNTIKLTKECIQSVLINTINLKYEIILVDNASVDNSVEIIRNEFPSVFVIDSKKNLGFGRANNLGLKNSKGKYVFLLNPDTILLNNAVLKFFQFMEEKNSLKNIGAIGSVLLDENLNPIHSSRFFPYIWQFLKKRRVKEDDKKERLSFRSSNYFEVDYITGADLFMLKETIMSFGGFDPDFFMYYEETDLQKRMSKKSLKRLIIKGPKIIHLEGMSFNGKVSNLKRIIVYNSMFLYHKKHNNFFAYFIYRLFYLLFRFSIIFENKTSLKEKKMLLKILVFNPVLK